jgi:hypothetical protein
MISFRYISFTIYYVFINLFIIKLNELTLESMSALFLSTLIFFYIIKFIEYKDDPKVNNTDTKTRLLISILYGILSLSIKYVYDIFINIDSINTIFSFLNTTYIPEALFISGGLLFLNQLMNIAYPYL